MNLTMQVTNMKLISGIGYFICLIGAIKISASALPNNGNNKVEERSAVTFLYENVLYYSPEVGATFEKIFSSDRLNSIVINFSSSEEKDRTAVFSTQMKKSGSFKTIEAYSPPPRFFSIIDNKGKVIFEKEFQDVKSYSWSPDGEKLAFIEGIYGRSENPDNSSGIIVWEVNPISGTSRKLYEAQKDEHLGRLTWAKFDNNIYVQLYRKLQYSYQRGVFRLDVDKQSLIPTNYKGLNFSPDGNYYYWQPTDARGRLYNRVTNEEIPLSGNGLVTDLMSPYFIIIDWISENDKTYAIAKDASLSYVYWRVECETGICTKFSTPEEAKNAVTSSTIIIENGKPVWSNLN